MTDSTRRYWATIVLCSSMGLVACGQAETGAAAEEQPAAAAPAAAPEQPAPAVGAGASTGPAELASLSELQAKGKRLYLRCAACHSVTAADGNKVGPHLEGIMGRQIGSVAGYNYSEQLREADAGWTAGMLDEFIAEPRAVFSKTTMVFAGIKREEDRAALIAYLETF